MKIGKRLKTLRKERKMTLKELSQKSGVQVATLSRMENNILVGPIKSHINICKALGVFLSDFYRQIEEDHKMVSLSKPEAELLSYANSREYSTEMLVKKVLDQKMMPFLLRIKKDGKTEAEKEKRGSQKFTYVLEGRIKATVGEKEYELLKAESIYFDASLSHVFYNLHDGESCILSVLSI